MKANWTVASTVEYDSPLAFSTGLTWSLLLHLPILGA